MHSCICWIIKDSSNHQDEHDDDKKQEGMSYRGFCLYAWNTVQGSLWKCQMNLMAIRGRQPPQTDAPLSNFPPNYIEITDVLCLSLSFSPSPCWCLPRSPSQSGLAGYWWTQWEQTNWRAGSKSTEEPWCSAGQCMHTRFKHWEESERQLPDCLLIIHSLSVISVNMDYFLRSSGENCYSGSTVLCCFYQLGSERMLYIALPYGCCVKGCDSHGQSHSLLWSHINRISVESCWWSHRLPVFKCSAPGDTLARLVKKKVKLTSVALVTQCFGLRCQGTDGPEGVIIKSSFNWYDFLWTSISNTFDVHISTDVSMLTLQQFGAGCTVICVILAWQLAASLQLEMEQRPAAFRRL